MNAWPPVVPHRLENRIRIETVDENTVKIIDKNSGAVLQTLTKTEYDSVANPVIPTHEG